MQQLDCFILCFIQLFQLTDSLAVRYTCLLLGRRMCKPAYARAMIAQNS